MPKDDDRTGWPALRYDDWKDSCQTLHLWTQMVGKTRMALTPAVNHWWHVPLYLTARGLTTSPIPYGERRFELTFDLVEHNLHVDTAEGQRRSIPLVSRTVAAFYAEYRAVLRALALDLHFWTTPVEIPDPIPFEEDYSNGTYDPAAVRTFFEVLARADLALKEFQGRFTGKQSPVHFFWGSFDLAAARYSGRRAPERPGADTITKEGYSHEELAFGFWPGAAGILDATFYAYAAPEPPGFKGATVRPPAARYHPPLGEFVLPYEELRHESDPHWALLEFFQSAYDAGAALGRWDRASLDRAMPAEPGRQPGA